MVRKAFFIILALILAYTFVQGARGEEFKPWLFVNTSASIPLGIYIAVPTVSMRNGDIVAYESPEMLEQAKANGWLPENVTSISFLKHIAIPGSVYHLGEDGSFSINGEYIGQVTKDDGKGHDLPQLPKGHYVVHEGEYLPYTPEARSFDGRYMGTISESMIIHRIVPLLTW